MADARRSCVDMRQLLDRAGAVISGYTHAEASHVVSGCAAGLLAGAAAILTGDDPAEDGGAAAHRRPDERTSSSPCAFSAAAHADGQEYAHRGYAQAVHGAGGRLVEVGGAGGATRAEFEAAFGPGTAGVYWTSDGVAPGVQLDEVIADRPRARRAGAGRRLEHAAAGRAPAPLHRPGRRPGRLLRRQGAARPARLGHPDRPGRPDRGRAPAERAAPGHRPAAEGLQGGDRRPADGAGDLGRPRPRRRPGRRQAPHRRGRSGAGRPARRAGRASLPRPRSAARTRPPSSTSTRPPA